MFISFLILEIFYFSSIINIRNISYQTHSKPFLKITVKQTRNNITISARITRSTKSTVYLCIITVN